MVVAISKLLDNHKILLVFQILSKLGDAEFQFREGLICFHLEPNSLNWNFSLENFKIEIS